MYRIRDVYALPTSETGKTNIAGDGVNLPEEGISLIVPLGSSPLS